MVWGRGRGGVCEWCGVECVSERGGMCEWCGGEGWWYR